MGEVCHDLPATAAPFGSLAAMRTLVVDGIEPWPGYGTAVSRALLRRAAAGQEGEVFRLSIPRRAVAFGKHDTLGAGYPQAAAIARSRGFAAIERMAGGRAAVFHEQTLAFSWTIPEIDPAAGIRDRFRRVDELFVDVLAAFSIVAVPGEVPGEYCPGAFSLAVSGRKVLGVGQRLTKGAAHVGGVLVVANASLINDVLVPVYEHLGIAWDPSTTGALTDTAPGLTVETVRDAVAATLLAGGDAVRGELDPVTVELADRLAPTIRSPSATSTDGPP